MTPHNGYKYRGLKCDECGRGKLLRYTGEMPRIPRCPGCGNDPMTEVGV